MNKRLLLLAVLIGAFGLFYALGLSEQLNLSRLQENRAQLEGLVEKTPLLAAGIFFSI